MKKRNILWSISDLIKRYKTIEFPEFQREPTVWDINKKQKLIDSLLRNFDIASIYLYKREDGIYECIDGRQRINAIVSFLGLNEGKADDSSGEYNNNFKFISSDELLGENILDKYNNKRWEELTKAQQKEILDFEFNVIEMSEMNKDGEELNLMFLRLQLGAPLNAGEKLNAMLGDMKKYIFGELGTHKYFELLNIPKRRFSKQLTASQIAINFFSIYREKQFQRARFVDLQEFFKQHLTFSAEDRRLSLLLIERLNRVITFISRENAAHLKNRAIGVSVFLFLNDLIEKRKEGDAKIFIKFLIEFLKRLRVQIEKGIDIETRYRDLLKFQTYISQAAVERYAIENRQKFLEEYFEFYKKSGGKIKGDK